MGRTTCMGSFFAGALVMVLGATSLHAEENLDSEVKDMTWVGFQQLKDASRVYIKTTEPVKYTVDDSHDDMVILTLDNTRVPIFNNTRALPTQYFNSPVALIEIKPIEAPSPSVRIEIHTRVKAAYKKVQKDTMLALDFPLH